MSTDLTKQVVKDVARRYRHAAAGHLRWQEERQHVEALIAQSKRDGLKACAAQTIEDAVLQAASMGLTLNPARKHCYLIPRRMKKGDPNSPMICYASPSYMGLVYLAVTLGGCQWVRAEVVFKGDHFVLHGPFSAPEHQPTTQASARQHQHAIGAYACVKTAQGDVLTEYVDRDQVEASRKKSEAPNSLMWTSFWPEAWKKVAIRRLYKTAPQIQGGMMDAAVAQMDTYEGAGQTFEGEYTRIEPIDDKQRLQLEHIATEFGRDPTKAVTRLAKSYGFSSIEELPEHKFEEARDFMQRTFEEVDSRG